MTPNLRDEPASLHGLLTSLDDWHDELLAGRRRLIGQGSFCLCLVFSCALLLKLG